MDRFHRAGRNDRPAESSEIHRAKTESGIFFQVWRPRLVQENLDPARGGKLAGSRCLHLMGLQPQPNVQAVLDMMPGL